MKTPIVEPSQPFPGDPEIVVAQYADIYPPDEYSQRHCVTSELEGLRWVTQGVDPEDVSLQFEGHGCVAWQGRADPIGCTLWCDGKKIGRIVAVEWIDYYGHKPDAPDADANGIALLQRKPLVTVFIQKETK